MALIFVRHGQAVDETELAARWKEAAHQPWSPPLSPVGQREVNDISSELDDHRRRFGVPPLKRVFSSPFLACIETASTIAEEAGLARVCVDPSLSPAFSEDFYRSWAVPGRCVAKDPTEEVRPEALIEAGLLLPCDWARQPQEAPAFVDAKYEPVLRPSLMQSRWGSFEAPSQARERLHRFLNFVTHAFSKETVLIVSHSSVLHGFLQRECPSFRMNTDRCCSLYLSHTASSNGFCWRALGLASPGCVPVELNLELEQADWAAPRADDSSQKDGSGAAAPREFTAEEALEMLQRMKEREGAAEAPAKAEAKARGGPEGGKATPHSDPAPQPDAQEDADTEDLTQRDVAHGRPVKASSMQLGESEPVGPECAVDGDPQTRWLSVPEDNQWLCIDLGRAYRLARVEIDWAEQHYPENYLVQGGADGVNWITLAMERGSSGGVVTQLPAGTSARWVRIYAQQPAEQLGFSIWHMRVFNCPGPATPSTSTDMEPTSVTVSTIAGEQVTLYARPGEPVASLSQRVSQELGWGSSMAKLASGSEVLDLAATLPAGCRELVAVREPRATRALSGSIDGTLQLFNVESGEALCTLRGHNAVVTCVAADFLQQRALSGSRDRTLRVWNLETGQVLMLFEAHEGHVNCVAADFGERLALSGSDDKTLRLWDLVACQEVRSMSHGDGVTCMAVDFARGRALAGGQDGMLHLWDLETGKALWEQLGHRGAASCLAADFRLQQAISGADDKLLRLWDMESGQPICTLRGHTSFVRCVEADFSLGRALSGGADATLRLWDLERQALLLTIRTNAGWVWCLAANFEEERALSGSARENSLRMWDLKSGDPVSAASPALGTQGVRCVVTNFA